MIPHPRSIVKKFAVVLLACSVVGVGILHPPHIDLQILVGHGRVAITTHADADHCKHLPLSDDSQCAICNSLHSRLQVDPTVVGLSGLEVVGGIVVSDLNVTAEFPLRDSFYRRGPPSLLG